MQGKRGRCERSVVPSSSLFAFEHFEDLSHAHLLALVVNPAAFSLADTILIVYSFAPSVLPACSCGPLP